MDEHGTQGWTEAHARRLRPAHEVDVRPDQTCPRGGFGLFGNPKERSIMGSLQKEAAWFDLLTGKRLTEPSSSVRQLVRDAPGYRVQGKPVDPVIKIRDPHDPIFPMQWRLRNEAEILQY